MATTDAEQMWQRNTAQDVGKQRSLQHQHSVCSMVHEWSTIDEAGAWTAFRAWCELQFGVQACFHFFILHAYLYWRHLWNIPRTEHRGFGWDGTERIFRCAPPPSGLEAISRQFSARVSYATKLARCCHSFVTRKVSNQKTSAVECGWPEAICCSGAFALIWPCIWFDWP